MLSGIAVPEPGKAIGIVAADLDGSGRLSLYLANDVGPNFLFVNHMENRGGIPQFTESGLLAGVALNAAGNYESGMGIAAGDSNLDGHLDLFVTNFDNETNTLYQYTHDNLFLDHTGPAGFDKKTNLWVGWGTQFIDGELDGRPDLILTNGHVNDLGDHGKAFQMPTQYFSNVGGARFVERPADELGPHFLTGRVGRGMARID